MVEGTLLVEKDKRRLDERGGGGRRQRQGCSRMRQDLITPYNVLFCGCLAYTPIPVCRLENTVNTPMALLFLLLLSSFVDALSQRVHSRKYRYVRSHDTPDVNLAYFIVAPRRKNNTDKARTRNKARRSAQHSVKSAQIESERRSRLTERAALTSGAITGSSYTAIV